MTATRARFVVGCLGCMACLTLAPACGEEAAAPAADPNAPKPMVAAAKGPEPVADPNGPAPFVYSPVGKRDPFRSYLLELALQATDTGPTRKKEETEDYEIDQYRLTGLITGTAQPKAMVEDPAGRGHVLRIGTRLGKNGGRVSRISNFGIIVVEETRDPTGKRIKLPIAIKLPRSEFEDIVQK